MPMPRRHFERPCAHCGRTYLPYSTISRYCGRPCSDVAATKPRPKCHVCGVSVGLGRTACIAHHHSANRAKRVRPCARCGEDYIPSKSSLARGSKFCSYICFRADIGERRAMLSLSCPQCGAGFRRTRAAVARVKLSFCSLACAMKYNSGERHVGWRGGSDPNRGEGWRRLAEEIRERDGYRCRRCGKTQEENKQRLSVDHIIPWRSFTDEAEANDPSNLVAVCRSCHAKKNRAERLWLKGDVIDMWRYQVAVSEPWKATA